MPHRRTEPHGTRAAASGVIVVLLVTTTAIVVAIAIANLMAWTMG